MSVSDCQHVKEMLTEAIMSFCKSLLSCQSELSIEGLLGITIDRAHVLLVGINETVVSNSQQTSNESLAALQINDAGSISQPTILLVTTTDDDQGMIASSSDVNDFSQSVSLFEMTATGASTTSCSSDGVVTEIGTLHSGCGTGDESNCDTTATGQSCTPTDTVKDDDTTIGISNEENSSYSEELDSVPHSSLFTSAELDEFIVSVGRQCASDETAESSNDVVFTSADDVDKTDAESPSNTMVESDSLLLPSDVHIAACLTWDVDDDDLSDIGPLNLAGPQDLSTGFGKKGNEDCKDESSSDEMPTLLKATTTSEPLNLISRPLDLTVGVRDDDDDDDAAAMYGILMSGADTAGLITGDGAVDMITTDSIMAAAAAAAAAAAVDDDNTTSDPQLSMITTEQPDPVGFVDTSTFVSSCTATSSDVISAPCTSNTNDLFQTSSTYATATQIVSAPNISASATGSVDVLQTSNTYTTTQIVSPDTCTSTNQIVSAPNVYMTSAGIISSPNPYMTTAGIASAPSTTTITTLVPIISDISDQQLACICGKTFDCAEPFASHISACAKSKLTPYKSCDACGKVLFSVSGYVKHRKLHTGRFKYYCSVCHQGFFDQTNLQAHADAKHSKLRRYQCQKCSKSFFRKHHLKRHMGNCCLTAAVNNITSSDMIVGDTTDLQ